MSRVGRRAIDIPANTKVEIKDNLISVKGPKGALQKNIHPRIKLEVKDNTLIVKRPTDSATDRSLHGLTRNIIFNMVKGVNEGISFISLILPVPLCLATGQLRVNNYGCK